jgi:hypothetical protein
MRSAESGRKLGIGDLKFRISNLRFQRVGQAEQLTVVGEDGLPGEFLR